MKSFTATASRTTIVLAAIILLAACGQKGPLYLPQSDNQNDSSVQEQSEDHSADSAVVNETQPAASVANTNI
jgi:predicted small lipoprotein YifL